MRALAFSTGFRWHIGEPTPVEDVRWDDLTATGRTDLGGALTELARVMVDLERDAATGSFVPPAIVLVSDGHPTDEFGAGLRALLATSWGSKAARIAVGIGDDAHKETLSRFMGTDEIPALGANEPDALVVLLKWASTVAVGRASSPPRAGDAWLPPTPPAGLGDHLYHIGPGGTLPPITPSDPAAATVPPPNKARRVFGA